MQGLNLSAQIAIGKDIENSNPMELTLRGELMSLIQLIFAGIVIGLRLSANGSTSRNLSLTVN